MEFGKSSKEKLATCHPDLQRLFNEVIKVYDCTVIEGHRTMERQLELVAAGKSRTKNSKHLTNPSKACDVVPNPVDWEDLHRFRELAAVVIRIAHELGIKVKWGGTFRGFFDGPHWEIVE